MATQFSVLFTDFLNNKVRDVNLATRYTPDALSELLSGWLKDGRELFRDLAIEDETATIPKMEDVVESTRTIYEYSFTGTSNTTVLSPVPTVGSEFYATVNDEVWIDFSYDEGTNEMTINNAPDQLNTVDIGAYFDGQFNQTLNLTEQRVLVDIMQLVFSDVQVMNEKLLNQRVYGKDYGMHSQANHITSMERLTDIRYIRLVQRMNLYTYRQDPDELSGLGGRK